MSATLQGPDKAFTIFRAGPADCELARQAITEVDGRSSCSDVALAEFLSDPARYVLLALEFDRVIGSLNGYALRRPYRLEPQFLLYEIGVRPGWQNRGVGRALVERFIVEARTAGAFEVWVVASQSNRAAMAMYSSCGLRPEHDDDVVLNLTLTAGESG